MNKIYKKIKTYFLYKIDCNNSKFVLEMNKPIKAVNRLSTQIINIDRNIIHKFPEDILLIEFEIPLEINQSKIEIRLILEYKFTFFKLKYFSEQFNLSLNENISNYFYFKVEFLSNSKYLMNYKEPPGESIISLPRKVLFYFKYIVDLYLIDVSKLDNNNEEEYLLTKSLNKFQDLLLMYQNFIEKSQYKPKFRVEDFLKYFETQVKSNEYDDKILFTYLISICLLGIIPHDMFYKDSFKLANSSFLLSMTNHCSELTYQVIKKYEHITNYLENGLIILMSLSIKEGDGEFSAILNNKNLDFIIERELFNRRICDYIGHSGIPINNDKCLNEINNYFLKVCYSLKNDDWFSTNVLKNLSKINKTKEFMINLIIQFREIEKLHPNSVQFLTDEIKRKKWLHDDIENITSYISKINEIILSENNKFLKNKFKELLYGLSTNITFIFTLLRTLNYEDIESDLVREAINNIYTFTLEDYGYVLGELKDVPVFLKSQIIEGNFYEKIKSDLRKLAPPFNERIKQNLKCLLLSKELFPVGSLDYIEDFINSKLGRDDLKFIIKELIVPQKKYNNEKYYDIWQSIKKYIFKNYNELNDIIKNFSICIKQIPIKFNDQIIYENMQSKKTISIDFWKMIYQRFSKDIFIHICHYFNSNSDNHEIDPIIEETYIESFNYTYCGKANQFDLEILNKFLNSLCNNDENGQKILISNNKSTECIINCLLDYLFKESDPRQKSNIFLIENIEKDHFWMILLNSTGNYTNYKDHKYLKSVIYVVGSLYQGILEESLFVIDFLTISKLDTTKKDTFCSLISSVIKKQNKSILAEIEEKLIVLEERLKAINIFEEFFDFYKGSILNSEIFCLSLKELKNNFSSTDLKNLRFDNYLYKYKDEVEKVNHWSYSVLFRNILDDHIKLDKKNEIKENFMLNIIDSNEVNPNVISFEELLIIAEKSIEKIKSIANSLSDNEMISKINLKNLLNHFRGITSYEKETNLIASKMNYGPMDKIKIKILRDNLKVMTEISEQLKFSNVMNSLNNNFRFSNNKCKFYNFFLDIISNPDSTLDQFIKASKDIAYIKSQYLAEDIENIIFELSEDKDLIDFLITTPEEDIRNMVDAVDEHGDSFIRVQTIRDLLIIGSFIQALGIKKFDVETIKNPSEDQFIKQIETTVKTKKNFSNIDVLMNSCMKQIVGIKHLYRELSNREEASKIKAKEISLNSIFEFYFNQKNIYDLKVVFGKTDKKILFRELCDLRDRVLLLLYNEKQEIIIEDEKQEKKYMEEEYNILDLRTLLQSFIKVIDLSEKILFILNDLYSNGFPIYFSKSIEFRQGKNEKFDGFLEEISFANNKWNEDIQAATEIFYALTYLNGKQYWELEKVFIEFCEKKQMKDIVNLPGYYLIKYIDPEFDLRKLENIEYKVDKISTPKEKLFQLGAVLTQMISIRNPLKDNNLKRINIDYKDKKFIFSSPSNRIYSYLLSIHFSIDVTLPQSNQIFYCCKTTIYHEIVSFLLRFIYCPIRLVFTMLRLENLSIELQNFLVEQINKISHLKINSVLSLICSDINSYIYSQFTENSNVYIIKDSEILDDIVLIKNLQHNALVIKSEASGSGKSFFIAKQNIKKFKYIDFPISDSINLSKICERLSKFNQLDEPKFIHITLQGIIDDYEILDYILFKYIIICCLKNDIYVCNRNNSDPLFIELAHTYNDSLFNSLSILSFCKVLTIKSRENLRNIEVPNNIDSNIQLVCNYLYHYKNNTLNSVDIIQQNMIILTNDQVFELLKLFFIKDNPEITFRQINVFISVLANQLKKFSSSTYFTIDNLQFINNPLLNQIRQKIMYSFILMTEEFTTRSIKTAKNSQDKTKLLLKNNFNNMDTSKVRDQYINNLSGITSWSSSNHLIVMFHEDSQCITPIYKYRENVVKEVIDLVECQKGILENYQNLVHLDLLDKLLRIVGKSEMFEILKTNSDYVLTVDNFLKMLLIIMRARSFVPIVIMGETGCGKTSLIKFLARSILYESFEIVNFHAGIKEEYIIQKMRKIIENIDRNIKLWVFLDEINTCDCLGIINEMICQRTILGSPIPENIVFVAACNPYKLRNENTGVGLIKYRIESSLVYRVHPLPDSLIDYIWDYGRLSESEEKMYIENILSSMTGSLEFKRIAIDLASESQIFLRKKEDDFSVSLRDIVRFKTLHEWFKKILKEKNDFKKNPNYKSNDNKRYSNQSSFHEYYYEERYSYHEYKYQSEEFLSKKAIILSLIISHYNRISKNQDRFEYIKILSSKLDLSVRQLNEIVYDEQKDIINRMELPDAIAINIALLENVFTLLVCVVNKIPLFICGKPGCSKSLSVQLLVSNLRGQDSHDSFFKRLPRILPVPYQGSESSTSEGIERVFEKAYNVLKNNNDSSILPLVVIDEIGLAEKGKNNSLKVLHSLLEPEKTEIAFVGISNWKLDASKMNRAIYLARPDPDLSDLESTAISIFDFFNKSPKNDEKEIMKALAKSYYEFKILQSKMGYSDFHGTRDFYSLIKQVTRLFKKYKNDYREVKNTILKEALCRNFGGLSGSINAMLRIFSENNRLYSRMFDVVKQNSIIQLIKNNLTDVDSRFLLLFSNGNSASFILDNYLKTDLKERVFVIGSEFEDDKDKEEYGFRLLSDIILYMESGNSIILKNLDQIYGSLYDLFNQNFMVVGKKKNCRIALGSTNNPMCYVHDNFHCVVLVDFKHQEKMDPPFLNRFEKQILTFDSVLTNNQKRLVQDLENWILDITRLAKINILDEFKAFDKRNLIITYNDELCPSIVLTNYEENKTNEEILENCKKDVLSVASISFIVYSYLSEMSNNDRHEVTKAKKIYFEEQQHDSLSKYLLHKKTYKPLEKAKIIVYSYSNILDELKFEFPLNYLILNIAEIKSEKEFDFRFKKYLKSETQYIFIKFDVYREKRHIPMIKFKVDKMLNDHKKFNKNSDKNVVMILYLSRILVINEITNTSDYYLESNFLSDWDQIMIDCLIGGQMENLANVIDLNTIELLKMSFGINTVTLIYNLFLKFNYVPYNQLDLIYIKTYSDKILKWIQEDHNLLETIYMKSIEFLDGKVLKDWKIKVCCDKKILSKSFNTFSAINDVVNETIEDPLLKILYYLESESAIKSYFYDSEYKELFKAIWTDLFDLIDFNTINPYNVVQSLVVNTVFELNFPFSRRDIYQITLELNKLLKKVEIYEEKIISIDDEDIEINSLYEKRILKIIDMIKKKCVLYRLFNNPLYNESILEITYIKDIITYFTIVELKREIKWRNSLEIILSKCFNFDLENLPIIYIFLWKNLKSLDVILKVFDALLHVADINDIENLISENILYSNNLRKGIRCCKKEEIDMFTKILDECGRLILSKMGNLKIYVNLTNLLNVYMLGIAFFSFAIQSNTDAMIVIFIVNEYLKILTLILNDYEKIAKYTEDLFDGNPENINLKDFIFLPKMIEKIDKLLTEIHLNTDDIISVKQSKLIMFEKCIVGRCSNEIKILILNCIVNDEIMIKYSEIIFFRLIRVDFDENYPNYNQVLKSLEDILRIPVENLSYDSTAFVMLIDFLRKILFEIPTTDEELTNYLINNLDMFEVYLDNLNFEGKFERLIAFSGVKHYLELYGKYLFLSSTIKLVNINQLNNLLNSQKPLINLCKDYLLKCLAAYLGGSSKNLLTFNFDRLKLSWVNNIYFEENYNVLGIEPHLYSFDTLYRKFNLCFISILNGLEENFIDLTKKSKENQNLKFILIQFFISNIYLSFTNKDFQLSQTLKNVQDLFRKSRKDVELNMGVSTMKFIEKLVFNFNNNQSFSLKPTSPSNIVGFNSVQMQIFNYILCFPDDSLAKIYYGQNKEFSLEKLYNSFIPGGFDNSYDERTYTFIKTVSENYAGFSEGLYECSCGYLYTIGNCTKPAVIGKCPKCGNNIGGTGYVLVDGNRCLFNADSKAQANKKEEVIKHLIGKLITVSPGLYGSNANELGNNYSVRSLSNLGFRFLSFFTHSILSILLEIDEVKENELTKNFKGDLGNNKIIDYLKRIVAQHIDKLTEIISFKEPYVFLLNILDSLILTNKNYDFSKLSDRDKFEIVFQADIINQKANNIANDIQNYISSYKIDKKLNYFSILDEQYKTEEIKELENREYFRAFRYSRLGNWQDLKKEFEKKNLGQKYQFLKIIIEKFDDVFMLSEIYPIIQFTNFMLNTFNYSLTRIEAKEKTIRRVLNDNPNGIMMFKNFANAWKKIAPKVTQYGCKILPILEEITMDMPVSFVLVDDKELGYGMYVSAALQYIGKIQNEVLESIVFLIKENNNYQLWGNTDTTAYSIQKISQHDLIMYQTEKDIAEYNFITCARFYCIYNPNYGQGSIVEYNFGKIENELALKFLANKKFLKYDDLNKIQFKFELLSFTNKNSNLLNDVKSKIKQILLDGEELKIIKRTVERLEQQNVAYLHQIFSSLEIILCSLKYTVNPENVTISTYSQNIQAGDKISYSLREVHPLNNIKLSHIISFYELIEQHIFKYVIEFISPEYKISIKDYCKTYIENFLKSINLKENLYPSCKQLINTVQRFIIRCLVSNVEGKCPIKEYLIRNDFWDLNINEETIERFHDDFPEEVLVSNTVSLLNFLLMYSNNQESEKNKENYNISKEKANYIIKEELNKKKKNKFF